MSAQYRDNVKFYADCPDQTKNKLFCYRVKDIGHSLDLLLRFQEKGFSIRRAYHHYEDGKQISISKEILTRNYSNIELGT
jgi:hypothetical protein